MTRHVDFSGPDYEFSQAEEKISGLKISLKNAIDVQHDRFKKAENDMSDHELLQKHCQKHGPYKCIEMTMAAGISFTTETKCPGCVEDEIYKLEKRRSDLLNIKNRDKVRSLMREAGISKRFDHCTFDNYDTGSGEGAVKALKICKRYAEKWPDRLSKGGGLVLCGKPGTGKNHLATCVTKEVINNHQGSVKITSALKVIREIKNTWSRDSEKSEQNVIDSMKKVDLLIIDEVGVQFGSETELMLMFEVINGRYEAMKPTILISNLNREELAKFIGERVLDRMNEGGGATIVFDWESYRK